MLVRRHIICKVEDGPHFVIYKGKVVSIHAKQAQRGGRGITLPILDPNPRKAWVISATLEPLFSRRTEPVLILQEAGWASGTENLVTTWVRSGTINPVTNRYTNYTIAIILLYNK